jgi:hypothetical protein
LAIGSISRCTDRALGSVRRRLLGVLLLPLRARQAIVKEIAELHNARIEIDTGAGVPARAFASSSR